MRQDVKLKGKLKGYTQTPLVLTALAEGRQLSAGEQKLDGEETVFLELANPKSQDEDNRVLCWLEKSDGALRRAEVLSAGMTVVTLVFSEFTYTFDIQE